MIIISDRPKNVIWAFFDLKITKNTISAIDNRPAFVPEQTKAMNNRLNLIGESLVELKHLIKKIDEKMI